MKLSICVILVSQFVFPRLLNEWFRRNEKIKRNLTYLISVTDTSLSFFTPSMKHFYPHRTPRNWVCWKLILRFPSCGKRSLSIQRRTVREITNHFIGKRLNFRNETNWWTRWMFFSESFHRGRWSSGAERKEKVDKHQKIINCFTATIRWWTPDGSFSLSFIRFISSNPPRTHGAWSMEPFFFPYGKSKCQHFELRKMENKLNHHRSEICTAGSNKTS